MEYGYVRRNIEAEMARKHFYQKDMAKRMHRSDRTWRTWMNNIDCIPIGMLRCIANVLDVTVEDLLTERKGETK